MLGLRKRGRYWYARGTIPVRAPDGKITRVRIEESTRETGKARAVRIAADIAQHYHEQAYRPKPKSISFTEAAITYVESKNPSKRDRQFLAKLVAHFGETPIEEIDQAKVAEAAQALYANRTGSTHSRAVYAPVVAVLRLSGVRPDFARPSINRKPIRIPDDEWFNQVMPHCSPSLAALLVFITLTGRRITEALEAIDNGDGTATIGRTKTGTAVMVAIPSMVRDLLCIRGSQGIGQRLFTYGDRHNVYRELRKACKRAGVPYYGTHAVGRHSAASRLLREGYSTKFVAEALGWKSTRMVDLHYGHLEHSEVREEVKRVGDMWGRRLEKRQKKAENNE